MFWILIISTYLCLSMKKLLFIIVTLIVFRPVVPLADYLIDYEYISTVLCINKDKPEMKCNGKCYLMQELAKVAEEQKQDATKKLCSISFSLLFFQQEVEDEQEMKNNFSEHQKDVFYQVIALQSYVIDVLHPPLFV